MGHNTERLFRAQDGDHVDDHRQSHQCQNERTVSVRCCNATGAQWSWLSDWGRQLLSVQEDDRRQICGSNQVHQMDDNSRVRCRLGLKYWLYRMETWFLGKI